MDQKPCVAEESEPENSTDSPMCFGARDALLSDRRDWSNRRGGDRLGAVDVDLGLNLTVGASPLGAVTRDVAGLAALVAGLAGRVKGTTVGSRAVARDVAELAASIALHRLRLAVASEVVRTAALVARRRAGTAKATPRRTEAAAPNNTASAEAGHRGVGAVALGNS